MTTSEDTAWVRARARQLASDNPELEFEDAFVQACRERTAWKKKHGEPTGVTLGDLLKAKK